MTHLGSVKGDIAEKRVLLTAKSLRANLGYVTGARMATREEDAAGVDVWVETDLGDIPLQVKCRMGKISSERKIKYENAGAAMIYAGHDRSSATVRQELKAAIRKGWKRLVQMREEEAEWARECEA